MSDGLKPNLGTRKFLIVDDHAAFRQIIRPFLPEGTVDECDSGRAALARCAADLPDWVLMDIEMPGMDGLTATRTLKEHFPQVRVIVVTHHGDEDVRTEAMRSGASGFLVKDRLEDLRPLILEDERTCRP